jgi:hypothetical protein
MEIKKFHKDMIVIYQNAKSLQCDTISTNSNS